MCWILHFLQGIGWTVDDCSGIDYWCGDGEKETIFWKEKNMKSTFLHGHVIAVIAAGLLFTTLFAAVAGGHEIVSWGDQKMPNAPLTNLTKIAAGWWHTLALKSDGSIVGWGANYYGEAAPPTGNDFTAVAAGSEHSLALKSDGSIVGWGGNEYGQATPPAGNNFTAAAAGDGHSLAIKSDGSIVGWGYNGSGQATPPAGNNFTAVAAGGYYGLALKSDGSIVGWGGNEYGQATPPTGNDFTAVAAGGRHSLALKSDGSIVGWGRNDYGQATPPAGNNFTAIAAGGYYGLALKSDGSIVGWGENNYGQATPPAGNNFIAVAASAWHSLALKSDGSIVGWGYNGSGQATPPAGNNFTAIAAGYGHSLALRRISIPSGAYSGGDGSPGNPYQIANVPDWQELMATPGDWWDSCFILTADVNLAGVTLTPVGNGNIRFTGVFDGNDNIISNAVINQPTTYTGLFGYVGSGGQIKNLGVENVNITGRDYVGGLVGWNEGSLTSCYATGSVSGDSTVGGLVGSNYLGTLTSCYATCSVTGTNDVGGLVGANSSVSPTDVSLTDCYATGSVTGSSTVGGLMGYNSSGTLTKCYATGLVIGTDDVGGLVGANWGTITACFWDKQTSNKTVGVGGGTSTGVTGKTTAQMKTLSTFTSAGWDFASVWAMSHGQYPVLFPRQMGDLNSDARVDMQDFAIFGNQWREGI
jgi:hypothetical protein